MKIAYFLPHLVPGGITRSTPALAEQFIHNGHSVDFLSISIHPDTRDEITQLGINVIDLNASRTILAIPKLARYLKNEPPDILLSAQHYANLVSVWSRSLSRQLHPSHPHRTARYRRGPQVRQSLQKTLYETPH